jgi:hypothetical protein
VGDTVCLSYINAIPHGDEHVSEKDKNLILIHASLFFIPGGLAVKRINCRQLQ